MRLKESFDEEGIEIPFPHSSLYAGSETAPFPIKLVADEPQKLAEIRDVEKLKIHQIK